MTVSSLYMQKLNCARPTNVYTYQEYAEKSVTARQKLITVSIALSDTDLNVFRQFLDRCHKLRFISAPLNIR